MYPNQNPLSRLDQCPPFLAHALARERYARRRAPLETIVQRSGLSERTYLRTASKTSWESVKLGVIKKFLKGCGINPFKMRNQWRYLRDHGSKVPFLTKRQSEILNLRCAQVSEASQP